MAPNDNRYPVVANVPPFYQQKPTRGIDFYFSGTVALAAVVGAQAVIGGTPAVRSMDDYEGTVDSFTIYMSAPIVADICQWTLRFNQGPAPGWTIRNFGAAIPVRETPYEGPVQFGPGTLVDVLLTNISGTAMTVGVEVSGWTWPIQDRVAVFGNLPI